MNHALHCTFLRYNNFNLQENILSEVFSITYAWNRDIYIIIQFYNSVGCGFDFQK